jgi:hypothetical protein
MGFRNLAAHIAGVALIMLGAASTAQAQAVTFSDINDAVPSRFFDAATSAPSALDPNTLNVGFNSGRDWTMWKDTDFRASTAAYSFTTAMDTISFRVQAPAGFYISRITYTQQGTGSAYRTGKAAGAANWVVADVAVDLGTFATNPARTGTIDLTGLNMTLVPVSITNSLFAYATPTSGSASVAITSAQVIVELSPLVQ